MYSTSSFIRSIPIEKSEEKSDIVACLLVLGVRKYAQGEVLDFLSIMQDILFLGDWKVIYESDLMEKAFFLSMYAKGVVNNKDDNKIYVREYKRKFFDIVKIKKIYYRRFFSSWSELEINMKIKKDILHRLNGGILNELQEDITFYKKGDEVLLFILKVEEILELIYLHYVKSEDMSIKIEKSKDDLLKMIEKNNCLPPYCDFDI